METTKTWLKGILYVALATIIVAAAISGVLVFLAIGAVVGTIVLLALVIWFIAYLIKEVWDSKTV